jgi:hypothetical protein
MGRQPALNDFTYDVAAWVPLPSIIDLIERQIEKYGHGSWEQRDAISNLGRAGALLREWHIKPLRTSRNKQLQSMDA